MKTLSAVGLPKTRPPPQQASKKEYFSQRLWKRPLSNPGLQAMTAFSRFAPVHGPDLKGRLRGRKPNSMAGDARHRA
jgi:hypothetical protein